VSETLAIKEGFQPLSVTASRLAQGNEIDGYWTSKGYEGFMWMKVEHNYRTSSSFALDHWLAAKVLVFGDIVYVRGVSPPPGDDRLEWMPRIRKITPD